eukprot:CAMPEP_0184514384 /NCGR_PEP_ID=MMETSP0198_2-20121128/3935_1 /TAXON_ID=1112570 /ORGANISM="Thraustochytrium sp., Strain LLF1b" /LENGTH=96 /DNA_ID=CAMNT_0026904571 /DNA_START=508 /DNA_END=798 /DNA_ORIENTATION=-
MASFTPLDSTNCFESNGRCTEKVVDTIDEWTGRLLPVFEKEDYLLSTCGCGGVFKPGAPDYSSDPHNKVYCPTSNEKIALYEVLGWFLFYTRAMVA